MLNIINHSQTSMSDMSNLSNPQDDDSLLNHTTIVANSQLPSPTTL